MPFFIENKKFPHPAWTKDNDGHESLLDADLIDGYEFSDIDARYVNHDGDRLSGDLDFYLEDDVVKDACILEYDFSEDSSPIVDDTGGGHNCVLSGNTHKDETGYGAHQYHFDGTGDYGTITTWSNLNNLQKYTIEVFGRVIGSGTGSYPRFLSKGSSNGWDVEVYNVNHLFSFRRASTGAVGKWSTPTNSAPYGETIYWTLTHDTELINNDPIIYKNGIPQSLNEETAPSGQWSDDSIYNVFVGDRSEHDAQLNGYILLIRIHSRILTPEEVLNNYNIEKWRTGGTTKKYRVGILENGTNLGIEFTPLGLSLYDWRNTRNILNYGEVSNTLDIGNAGTGFALNGSSINITSVAGITINGLAYDVNSTTFDMDGTVIDINGSISLALTSPDIDINGSTSFGVTSPDIDIDGTVSVTITTPTINLNGTSVVISGHRVLTVSDKDVNSGIPQLDASGNLQVKGSKAYFALTSSEFFLSNRTNTEDALKLTRGATANIYTGAIQTAATIWSKIQTASDKDVINGIAALGAAGEILGKGPRLFLVRDVNNNIIISERTAAEDLMYLNRYAVNHYIGYIKSAAAWQRILHQGYANTGADGFTLYNNGVIGGGGSYQLDIRGSAGNSSSYIHGAASGAQWSNPLMLLHAGRSDAQCFLVQWDGTNYHAYVKHTDGWHQLDN